MIEQLLRRHRINPAVAARGANPEVKVVRFIGMDVACQMQNPRRPGTNRTNERRSERFARVTLREIKKCRPHVVLQLGPGAGGQRRGSGVMRFRLRTKCMVPAIQLFQSVGFRHDRELLVTHVFNVSYRQPGK